VLCEDEGSDGQPRPMLGRLPWLAFERRILAFFFLVFFDIGLQPYRLISPTTQAVGSAFAEWAVTPAHRLALRRR
jgi:hypothetical protein